MKIDDMRFLLDLEDGEHITARTTTDNRIIIEIGPDMGVNIGGPNFFKLARLVKAINEINHDK